MEEPAVFDLLMDKNVPHILEKIFISLDYESLKSCNQVSHTWNKLLKSEYFRETIKWVYYEELKEEEIQLREASGNGDTEEVRRLLSSGMLDVNAVWGEASLTPLGKAAQMGCENVVKLLLDSGADPDKADDYETSTPLHQASRSGHRDVVKRLLDGGAHPNKTREAKGITPLHLAVKMSHNERNRDVVEALLKGGADPNMGSLQDGETPLHSAAMLGNLSEVKLLIGNGADPNKPDGLGRPPLKWAKMWSNEEVVRMLIENGADNIMVDK